MTERVKSGLTWRGLETGYGEASEAPSNERDGQQIGFTYETPRQSSTLPGSSMHGASLNRRGKILRARKGEGEGLAMTYFIRQEGRGMARPLRLECPGAIYILTGRGNARQSSTFRPRGRGDGRKLAHLNFPPIPKPVAARSRGWVPTTPTTRGGVERKRASC
jgi:hypothetical protein